MTDDVDTPLHVDIEKRGDLFRRDFPERRGRIDDGGGVDEEIGCATGGEDFRGKGGDGRVVRDIDRADQRIAAQFGGDGIEIGGGTRASGDAISACGESAGHRRTESARDAGDEDEGLGGILAGGHRSKRERARKGTTNRSLRAR